MIGSEEKTVIRGNRGTRCLGRRASLCVQVRAAGRLGPWKPYSRGVFGPDEESLYRCPFTAEWFKSLADVWLERQFDESRAAQILGI